MTTEEKLIYIANKMDRPVREISDSIKHDCPKNGCSFEQGVDEVYSSVWVSYEIHDKGLDRRKPEMTDAGINNIVRGYVAMALAAQDDLTANQKEKIFSDLSRYGFDSHTVAEAMRIGEEMGLHYSEETAKKYFW